MIYEKGSKGVIKFNFFFYFLFQNPIDINLGVWGKAPGIII